MSDIQRLPHIAELANHDGGDGPSPPDLTPPWAELPEAAGKVALPAEPASWADIGALLGPIVWDWDKWLARGFLTILASRSGLGKSSIALRIAATFTRGNPWPDGSAYDGETGRVLWCEAEGAQALNLSRAIRWGMNPNAIVTPLGPLDDVDLLAPDHRLAIAHWAHEPTVRLVVVDSLSGAVAGKCDENSSDMLRIVQWLARLARDTRKPVLVCHHLRKKSQLDDHTVALDRLRGSSAIVQSARLVWALDEPFGDDRLRLSVIKSNLDAFPEPIGLRIVAKGVEMLDAAAPPPQLSAQDAAEALLQDVLAEGPMESGEVYRLAAEQSIARRTLERAKIALHVESQKDGARWFWQLPDWDSISGDVGDIGELDDVGELGKVANIAKFAKKHTPPLGDVT